MKNKICISIYGKSFVFDDIAIPLYHSLRTLGYQVVIKHNNTLNDATNILFGIHDVLDIDLKTIPCDSIIYNFEQFIPGSKAFNSNYINFLKNFIVWDYNEENITRLKKIVDIDNLIYVPFGYCKEMSRIDENYPKDIDICFYGAINYRRLKILETLKKQDYH